MGDHDQAIQAFADRFPALFGDLTQAIQADPASTRLAAGLPRTFEKGELVVNLPPELVSEKLGAGRVTQAFATVAGLLHFLARPGVMSIIGHPNWRPILALPVERATHLRELLAATRVKDWPWAVSEAAAAVDAPSLRLLGAQLVAVRDQLAKQAGVELETRYAIRQTPAEVLAMNQRPLRILVFAMSGSAYQKYCARDMADALNNTGVEARELIVDSGLTLHLEVLQAIREFDPDVLLVNGRHRGDFQHLPANLCVLSWDQDHALASSPRYASVRSGRDRLMLMVADWMEGATLHGVPEGTARHLNLGVNHRIYRPAETPVEPEFDVLFVGNIFTFDAYRPHIAFDRLDAGSQKTLLFARERLCEWIDSRGEDEPHVIPNTEQFLAWCMAQLGHDRVEAGYLRWLVHYFRYRIAHMAVRERFVSSLAEFRLGLFGKGWEAFPAVARFTRSEVENGPALRALIQRSAINIHLHTWTVHHPRLYDTAAAGGFLLVGRVEEAYPLGKVFDVGAELGTFGSIADLKKQVRHYLAHPDERRGMARRAAERCVREHTMESRMREAVSFLRESSEAQTGKVAA